MTALDMPKLHLGLLVSLLATGAVVSAAVPPANTTSTSRQKPAAQMSRRQEMSSGEIVWKANTDLKVVALTFDDGPDVKYTPAVLKLARDKGLRLTFFVVGKEAHAHPELVRQEVAEGHAVGNHTWDHPALPGKTLADDISEIERCEDEIEAITGERPHLFRPPKGQWDGETFLAASELGYQIVLWSAAVGHHVVQQPEAMAQRIIETVRPGAIILAHDGDATHRLDRTRVMKSLPLLVQGLQEKGYRFVTVTELLRLGEEAKRRQQAPRDAQPRPAAKAP
jgi:peptidoglycan/xylan/chitin deacetylase (PgdA/CDA1 family)